MTGMAREHRSWWAAAAAFAAVVVLPVEPAAAQGLWQPLWGADAAAPSRPAAGYAVSRPARSNNLFSPFGGPFSLFQGYDAPEPYDRGAYRTLCVRMCDGYYFPISHATSYANLSHDADKCAAACGGDARLFYHPNPGGGVESMLDLTGRAYSSYPTAFRYRRSLVQGCQCRPQPWTEAERARHRAYAAAQGPQADRHHDQIAPEPVDRTELPTAPARAAVTFSPHVPARSRPTPRRARTEQWGWFGLSAY
jgi:hypothetical protein